jgi:serine protease Do
MVLGFSAVAAIVLGVAVNAYLKAPPTARVPQAAEQLSASVHLVGGSEQPTWNHAASAVRPAVLSVRAIQTPRSTGAGGILRKGSAVVIDPRGYAITCEHVVAGASALEARRFHEPERWLGARLVASVEDLALLQIADDRPLAIAKLGDSRKVEVGDPVLAIGHPFGLGSTVTAGVVGRRHASLELPGGRRYSDLLQTDAPINEGSSGGPLVDLAGEVIGINVAIYAPTGVFSGAGFAIPSNRVRDFVERSLGRPTRGWGLAMVELTPELARAVRYPSGTGVMVSGVRPGSAGEAAKVRPGDVVIALGGKRATDLSSLAALRDTLGRSNPVELRIWRQGKELSLRLDPEAT